LVQDQVPGLQHPGQVGPGGCGDSDLGYGLLAEIDGGAGVCGVVGQFRRQHGLQPGPQHGVLGGQLGEQSAEQGNGGRVDGLIFPPPPHGVPADGHGGPGGDHGVGSAESGLRGLDHGAPRGSFLPGSLPGEDQRERDLLPLPEGGGAVTGNGGGGQLGQA
jgi:hypothetical protein